jgi:hypothetical protein
VAGYSDVDEAPAGVHVMEVVAAWSPSSAMFAPKAKARAPRAVRGAARHTANGEPDRIGFWLRMGPGGWGRMGIESTSVRQVQTDKLDVEQVFLDQACQGTMVGLTGDAERLRCSRCWVRDEAKR